MSKKVEWEEWMNPEEELPPDEGLVLGIVNGQYDNIAFCNAFCLVAYVEGEGWIVDGWSEWEDPRVEWWTFLPQQP